MNNGRGARAGGRKLETGENDNISRQKVQEGSTNDSTSIEASTSRTREMERKRGGRAGGTGGRGTPVAPRFRGRRSAVERAALAEAEKARFSGNVSADARSNTRGNDGRRGGRDRRGRGDASNAAVSGPFSAGVSIQSDVSRSDGIKIERQVGFTKTHENLEILGQAKNSRVIAPSMVESNVSDVSMFGGINESSSDESDAMEGMKRNVDDVGAFDFSNVKKALGLEGYGGMTLPLRPIRLLRAAGKVNEGTKKSNTCKPEQEFANNVSGTSTAADFYGKIRESEVKHREKSRQAMIRLLGGGLQGEHDEKGKNKQVNAKCEGEDEDWKMKIKSEPESMEMELDDPVNYDIRKDRLFFLQFPPDFTEPEGMAKMKGRVGKLRVHASGRTTIDWIGGQRMIVDRGVFSGFMQAGLMVCQPASEAHRNEFHGISRPVGLDEGERANGCCGEAFMIGEIFDKFIVRPDRSGR